MSTFFKAIPHRIIQVFLLALLVSVVVGGDASASSGHFEPGWYQAFPYDNPATHANNPGHFWLRVEAPLGGSSVFGRKVS
jgi:hypothetical protein